MVLGYKTSIMIGMGLGLLLFGGCGSGASDTTASDGTTQQNTNENNNTDNNDSDPVIAGYSTGNGVLIETRSNGTKRTWVNTQGTECLIYRIAQHPGTTILEGGTAHCQSLATQNYAGINTWRMPNEEEAVYLMAHANEGVTRLIYPDDNPNCQFMATTSSVAGNEGRFVYTTNNPNNGAFNNFDVEGKVRTTAGIRCVADQ